MAKKLAEHTPGRKIFSSKIATVIVWVTTIIWTVPTLGLFVTSFKEDKKILGEAWWVSLLNPDFTLANYKNVFFGDGTESLSSGVLPYFINSIVITCLQLFFRSSLQQWLHMLWRGSVSAAVTFSSSLFLLYKSCPYRCL